MVFPVNVPNALGVPDVTFAGEIAPIVLMTEDTFFGYGVGPQWGIFDSNGLPVVLADTITGFDYRKESIVADYPIEDGAFQSYDKVAEPADVRFRFTTGGSQAARQVMLDSLAAIEGDLNLYSINTPEETYSNFNVVHQDYRRTATAGLGMLTVDVWCREIRVTPPSTFGPSTVAPSGASPINGGTVQPTAPTAAQQAAVASGAIRFQTPAEMGQNQ